MQQTNDGESLDSNSDLDTPKEKVDSTTSGSELFKFMAA